MSLYKKVLLPISGKSAGSQGLKALEHALALSPGELILLHVSPPLPKILGGGAHQELKQENEAKSLTLLSPVTEAVERSKTPFHVRVEEGTPAETIVRVSHEEKADIIVMFTDGVDGLEDFLMGSITERVLRQTDTTLLVVRR